MEQKHSKVISHATWPFWVGGALTGLVASAYAIAFRSVSQFGTHFFELHHSAWAVSVPIAFFVSYFLVKKYSPEAAGSGIPQVMAALEHVELLNETKTRSLLGLKVIVVKVVSSLSALLVGGAIGREGPTIQIGACIFNLVGGKSKNSSLSEKRAFILAGGAAGLSAAFNTPLGGIVFAIEELARDSFKNFRTSVLLGVIIAGIVAQWILGSYLYLGKPLVTPVDLSVILFSLLIGVAGGALGSFFGTSLYALVQWRNHLTAKFGPLIMIGVFSVIFIGLAFYSNGLSLGSGVERVTALLMNQETAKFLDIPIRFLSMQVSYLVGGAGGIFSPSLSIGAHLGSWMGTLFHVAPEVSSLLVALAMISFLTGMSYAPFTSFVLVLEMTDYHSAVFPMMLSALSAHLIAKLIHPESIYERMSHHFFE